MPARNRIKNYIENAYYHIYNRGVEKRLIFRDKQDYLVYLSYLKTYLEPKDELGLQSIIAGSGSWREKDRALKLLRLNNFSETLSVLSFSLMPNHFHLLIKQSEPTTIDQFMNSLSTRYAMYMRKKYKRVGPLFQGVYKAVRVTTDEQLLYLTRYHHRNAFSALQGQALQSYPYSSYGEYLGMTTYPWVRAQEILAFFATSGINSYQTFVEGSDYEERAILQISKLTLVDDDL